MTDFSYIPPSKMVKISIEILKEPNYNLMSDYTKRALLECYCRDAVNNMVKTIKELHNG